MDPQSEPGRDRPVQPFPRNPHDDLDSYVGLDGQEAEGAARARGWTTVRSLPPGAIVTLEYMAGRLNFTVDEGRVRRCWMG